MSNSSASSRSTAPAIVNVIVPTMQPVGLLVLLLVLGLATVVVWRRRQIG